MPGSSLPPVRVAIVTLDNHLKGAVERADEALSADNIALTLEHSSAIDEYESSRAGFKPALR